MSDGARRALRHRRGVLLSCAALLASAGALAAGCGKALSMQHVGSETHFLDGCVINGCSGGLECIAGLCTRTCQSDSECTELEASATCSSSSGTSSCQLPCAGDGECLADNPGWTCNAGRCGAWALPAEPVGAATRAACPAPPEPNFAELFEVSTSVSQVPGPRSLLSAVADATGLYWMESDGSLMALPRGSATSVVLRPATAALSPGLVLISDQDHLYWDELAAPLPPSSAGAESPQGLLFRVAKAGGEPELLLRMNGPLHPLAATSSTVLLAAGSQELYALDSQSLRRVDAVPASTGGLQVRDDLAYWTLDSANPSASELFSAPLSGGPPRRLGELPNGVEFLVGKEVVLARQRRLQPTEPQRWVESFLRIDTATGCALELPGLEQSIDSMMVDDRYVYWRSTNLYAGATPLDAPAELALVRMDLQSLRIERLVSPALEPSLNHTLMAQDGEHLYLAVNGVGPLLAVRKPD